MSFGLRLLPLPDDDVGEEVALAVVAPTLDLQQLRAHCTKHIAAGKRPRKFAILPKMPKNTSGKPLKREISSAVFT